MASHILKLQHQSYLLLPEMSQSEQPTRDKFQVSIVNSQGKPFHQFTRAQARADPLVGLSDKKKDTEGDVFILAQDGERYSVRVRNTSDKTMIVNLTIDNGLSNGRGLLVRPNSTVEIKGFSKGFTPLDYNLRTVEMVDAFEFALIAEPDVRLIQLADD